VKRKGVKEKQPMIYKKSLIYLEPEQHNELRHLSVDLNRSMADMIREAIRVWLAQHKKKGVKK
jgi:predicted DNA-binding protein